MRVVIITPETDDSMEFECIQELLDVGVIVHIRKKNMTIEALKKYLMQFDENKRKNLTLHGSHELAQELNMGGIHLNSSENKPTVNNWTGRLSKSFHQIEDLRNLQKVKLDYCFISPVFSSISKQGYKATFNKRDLKIVLSENLSKTSILALGGVTIEKLSELSELNFDGAAILGNFWMIKDMELRKNYIQKIATYVKE